MLKQLRQLFCTHAISSFFILEDDGVHKEQPHYYSVCLDCKKVVRYEKMEYYLAKQVERELSKYNRG